MGCWQLTTISRSSQSLCLLLIIAPNMLRLHITDGTSLIGACDAFVRDSRRSP